MKLVGLLFLSALGTACYSFIPLVLQNTINSLSSGNADFTYYLVLMIIFYVLHDAISTFSRNYNQVYTVEAGNKLGEKYIEFLGSLPMEFFIDRGAARLTQILQSAKASLASNLQALSYSILPTIIQLMVAFSVLIASKDYYVLIAIFIYFSIYAAMSFLMVKKLAKIYMDTILTNIENSKFINVLVSNIETIKIFNAKSFALENYKSAQKNILKKWFGYFLKDSSMEVIRIVLFTALLIFVLFFTARRFLSGETNIGHFVMLNTYIFQICRPFESLVKSFGNIVESFVGMKPMADIFQIKIPEANSNYSITNAGLCLSIQNLSFKYDNRETKTFCDMSFDFPTGKIIAIQGASGSGKTTLLSLLLKLNTPSEGLILLEGRDIHSISDDEYFSKVCLITQDAGIFNDTLAFNLRIANPDASESMMIEALRLACLDSLLSKLPKGINSQLGERGLQLSGGERQRLNIARSFLREPQILFYDESTSALDSETESKVLDNIVSFHKGKTIVFITHHITPLKYCDDFIDLHNHLKT